MNDWKPLRLDIDPLEDALDPALIKMHAEIDLSDRDDVIDLWIRSAVRDAENFMHRTIVARSHRWVLDRFPCLSDEQIRLPRGNTITVDHIKYSTGGVITTLTGPSASPVGTGFQEDLANEDGGVILPVRGGSWPSVDCDVPAPVAITFTAGYTDETIPPEILHWIAFAVSDSNQNRDTGSTQGSRARREVMTSMLSPLILDRWY